MRILVATFTLLVVSGSMADESTIASLLREYLRAGGDAERAAIARRIAADAALDMKKMPTWLHTCGAHDPLDAGTRMLSVALENGESRTVHVRVPQAYDPKRPWPLIVGYHGTGGDGAEFIEFVSRMLGARADEFVIAAPTDYGQRVINQGGPPSTEHVEVLIALRKLCHIDNDRVYATGYSLGGHTVWTLALIHPDQFAACIPLAGSLVLPDTERYFPDFLPNARHTLVAAVWGAKDTTDVTFANQSPQGGIAGINRRLATECAKLNLRLLSHEYADKGHGGIAPPPEMLDQALAARRQHAPRELHHTFRNLAQAPSYWVEPRSWRGPSWGDNAEFKGTLRKDEDPRDALAREIRKRLGRIEASVDGQTITLRRKNVDDVVIWLGDDLVDWAAPVKINHMGKVVFDDGVAPDVELCLAQVTRTWDFDRLRWSGIIISGGKKPVVLHGADPLPPRRHAEDSKTDR
ncbi:MAG: hypothetical protein JNG88_02590 [Phycisphaerales bacterium]|nr:hypothetical protein [Phycisphaerales bacterium]